MLELEQTIITYAKSQEPHECCGFVVLKGGESHFLPCENIAVDKENHFEISPEDYLNAEQQGEVIALAFAPQWQTRALCSRFTNSNVLPARFLVGM